MSSEKNTNVYYLQYGEDDRWWPRGDIQYAALIISCLFIRVCIDAYLLFSAPPVGVPIYLVNLDPVNHEYLNGIVGWSPRPISPTQRIRKAIIIILLFYS